MRTGFLGTVAVFGLLMAVPGMRPLALAQGVHEPTIDERYRDANSPAADTELPRLNPPQSKLAPTKAASGKSSTAAYLGVTFAGDERAAVVRAVDAGSPAEQAGLKANDVIETLQGQRIRNNQDVLDIGFSRRMSIRTQAPLVIAPTATPRSVGYAPDLPASYLAAPENPQHELIPAPNNEQRNSKSASPQTNRKSTTQNRNDASNGQRRNDNQKSNPSDENRRLLGRGLRLR
jgi:PDZ domain-containing protein